MVAFLRGINLGNRRVTNTELAAAFEGLGLGDPTPYQASGNVVFDGEAEASAVEAGLERALGYAVPVFLRSAADVRAVAEQHPFPATAEGKPQVMFLRQPPSAAATTGIEALSTAADRLAVGTQEVYWLPAAGVGRSELDMAAVETLVGLTTVRTLATVERITAKFLSPP